MKMIIKKYVLSCFVLYFFDLFIAKYFFVIPINAINVFLISNLGFSGLLFIIVLKLFW